MHAVGRIDRRPDDVWSRVSAMPDGGKVQWPRRQSDNQRVAYHVACEDGRTRRTSRMIVTGKEREQ